MHLMLSNVYVVTVVLTNKVSSTWLLLFFTNQQKQAFDKHVISAAKDIVFWILLWILVGNSILWVRCFFVLWVASFFILNPWH